jgi:transcriptional regulator with XRE-family HTH domain
MQRKLQALYEAMRFTTQAEMARHFEVSQGTMSRWLSGVHEPKGKVRDRINHLHDQLLGASKPDDIDESFMAIYQKILRLPPPMQRLMLAMWSASIDEAIALLRSPPKR